MTSKTIIRASIFVSIVSGFAIQSVAEEFSDSFITGQLERVQYNPDHRVSFEVSAPIEFVFKYLSERVADYAENAVAVEFKDEGSNAVVEPEEGTTRITLMEDNDALVQRFLLYEPPFRYAYFTDMAASTLDIPLAYSLSRYELSAVEEDLTKLDVAIVYESSSRWMAFFVNRAFRTALNKDFATAVQLIEQEYRSLKTR